WPARRSQFQPFRGVGRPSGALRWSARRFLKRQARHLAQGSKQRWRIENRKFLARGEKGQRFVKALCVFQFCTRDCELRVDLAAIARFVTAQSLQVRIKKIRIIAELRNGSPLSSREASANSLARIS